MKIPEPPKNNVDTFNAQMSSAVECLSDRVQYVVEAEHRDREAIKELKHTVIENTKSISNHKTAKNTAFSIIGIVFSLIIVLMAYIWSTLLNDIDGYTDEIKQLEKRIISLEKRK